MSAAAWPALVVCASSQPTNVLALLLNDDADLGAKLGAASANRRMDVTAIA